MSIEATDELHRAEQVLAATGVVTSPSAAPSLAPGSELRLAETSERYAVGGPCLRSCLKSGEETSEVAALRA
jgi:hypothetical protein